MTENIIPCGSKRIRENARRVIAEERLFHRQDVYSGSRDLTETEEELKAQSILSPEGITQLANKVKKRSQISLSDLRALKQSLCSQQNISAFLKVVGALPSVVGELTGRNALLQLEAAYICCNLALGDEHACSVVASAAGPYLLELLSCQTTSLQEACAWCLGNLTGGSIKALKLLQSQGLIPHLINCLNSPNDNVVDATVYALCHTLHSALSTQTVSEKDIQAIAFVSSKLTKSHSSVHWLVFLLSCSAWCDKILLSNAIPTFCMDFLSQKLHHISSQACDLTLLRSITSLLRAAANLCSEPSGQAAMNVLNHESFGSVIQLLSVSPHKHLQSECRWLAANLLSHSSSSVVAAAASTNLAQVVNLNHIPIS